MIWRRGSSAAISASKCGVLSVEPSSTMRILIPSRVCASILWIAARTVLAPLKTGTTTSINGSLRAILSGQQVQSLVNDYFCRFLHLMLWQNWVTAVPPSLFAPERANRLGHETPPNYATSRVAPLGDRALTALTIGGWNLIARIAFTSGTDCNDHIPHLGRTRQDRRPSRPDGCRQRHDG